MYSVSFLICATLLWADGNCASLDTVEEISNAIHGEVRGTYWYLISHHSKPIGHIQLIHRRFQSDGYEVVRTMSFRVTEGRYVEIQEVLQFSSTPPHRLTKASRVSETTQGGYTHSTAELIDVNEANRKEFADLSYLSTVPFNRILTSSKLDIATNYIDFDTKQLKVRLWGLNTLSEFAQRRFATSTDGTVVHVLSPKGIPLSTLHGDGIELTLAGRHQAMSWKDAPALLQTEGLHIPLNVPLKDPKQLTELTLRIEADETARALWQPLLNDSQFLHISNNKQQAYPFAADTSITNAEPRPQVDELMRAFTKEANIRANSQEQAVRAWINYLSNHIQYEEIDNVSSVSETLKRRSGDCTEFAELFNQVAIAHGWPSRTITGLVYHEESNTFRAHAWNEVVVEGEWIAIDVGWQQYPADATHVPFPSADVLSVLASAPRTQFIVVDQVRRSD